MASVGNIADSAAGPVPGSAAATRPNPFGWLAGLAPLWLATIGVLLISHRVAPRYWPRFRIASAAVGTLALLGLATIEAERREGSFPQSPGGGLLGRLVAHTMVDWIGVPSTALLLLGVVVFDVVYARRENRRLELAELLRLKREPVRGNAEVAS